MKKKYRLICDFSKSSSDTTIHDLQTYFATYIEPIDERLKQIPVVYVSGEEGYPAFKVMQQIWDNQGVSIMVFKEVQSGIKWFEANH